MKTKKEKMITIKKEVYDFLQKRNFDFMFFQTELGQLVNRIDAADKKNICVTVLTTAEKNLLEHRNIKNKSKKIGRPKGSKNKKVKK